MNAPVAPSAGGGTGPAPRTGSQIIVDTLIDLGVDTLFGYCGGVVLPLFDALYDAPIRVVVPRHEQGGCHMADGYARASGRVGVVLATSGPGATNLVTGLATAMMDSVPLVAITGQVRTALIGNDAFQEADTTGITRPVTKHNVIVKDVADLERVLREAFHVAATGRPGPVLVDIPVDVSVAACAHSGPVKLDLPGYRVRTKGHMRQIGLAAEAIDRSERPVLYVGGGVIQAGAAGALAELVRKAHVPVTMTLLGLGSFDPEAPECLGMLGMHGTAYANYAVQEADLLVAVGARFDDRVTGKVASFAPRAKVVHVDIDPASIAKNVPADIPVVGDALWVLTQLARVVTFRERTPWFERIAQWKARYPLGYECANGTLKPQQVIEEVARQTSGEAIVTTGVGQHQMWTAQYLPVKHPRHLITSGGLGTMGFGLPAAIGAQVACPDKTVIDIDGEHSFNMTLTELATAVEHGLPLKVVLLNNGTMGMVRQWQELFYGKRYSKSATVNPDYAKLAEALGAVGLRVTEPGALPAAIATMLAESRPCLVQCDVATEENVWPMVAAGKALHEMDGLDAGAGRGTRS